MLEHGTIKVVFNDKIHEVEKGITIENLLAHHGQEHPIQIVAAKVDNKIQELTYMLNRDCRVEFINLSSKDGIRIYIRGLTFIFIRACRELFPECNVSIEHSMSKG